MVRARRVARGPWAAAHPLPRRPRVYLPPELFANGPRARRGSAAHGRGADVRSGRTRRRAGPVGAPSGLDRTVRAEGEGGQEWVEYRCD